jgi:hypothetical protein
MTAPPRRFNRGLGRLGAKALTEISTTAERNSRLAHVLDRITSSYTTAQYRRPWMLAEITGNSPMSGASNRWEYEWREVEVTDAGSVQVKADGFDDDAADYAWNLCELINSGSGIEGPGWNLTTAPASFEIKPIDNCVVQLWSVRMSDGEERWVFQMANVLDGECEEEE